MGKLQAGVVGAGTMGSAIAEWLAMHGCDVLLQSRRGEARVAFEQRMANHFERRARRRRRSAAGEAADDAVVRTTDRLEDCGTCDLVIEASKETMEVKREIFAVLDRVTRTGTVIASTTSSLPISELAAESRRGDWIVGLHFFNPVQFVRVVEVVRGDRTGTPCVESATKFVRAVGKIPIAVRDGAGFLVNRLLIPSLFEGFRAYVEHAAEPAEIDQECTRWGMLIGPCAMLDLVGLDVALDICRNFSKWYGRAYQPPALLERCVSAGRLGRKVGLGIYSYPQGLPEPDPAFDRLRAEVEEASGAPAPTRFTMERMVAPMINEAVKCLKEGVATEQDIDFAMKETIGMPRGPLTVLRTMGCDGYRAVVRELGAEFGDRFDLGSDDSAFLESLAFPIVPNQEVTHGTVLP